jgi:hypothetical protein
MRRGVTIRKAFLFSTPERPRKLSILWWKAITPTVASRTISPRR